MNQVTIYSTSVCPYCVQAKALLDKLGVAFDEVLIDQDTAARQRFAEVTNGARTVPQIIIGDTPIGGFTELLRLQQQGELEKLLV